MKLEFRQPHGEDWTEVLREQRPGHYPEFLSALEAKLKGTSVGFDGFSGAQYRLRLSHEPHLIIERAGGPGEPDTLMSDLWPLLEWLIGEVGGEWTLATLRRTGSIYRAPIPE